MVEDVDPDGLVLECPPVVLAPPDVDDPLEELVEACDVDAWEFELLEVQPAKQVMHSTAPKPAETASAPLRLLTC